MFSLFEVKGWQRLILVCMLVGYFYVLDAAGKSYAKFGAEPVGGSVMIEAALVTVLLGAAFYGVIKLVLWIIKGFRREA